MRFLFYHNFVVAPGSLIIPEGKTNPVYLRAAMEKLRPVQQYHQSDQIAG